MRKASLALILIMFAVAMADAQKPGELQEKCSIEGLVVDGMSGRPLKRAELSMNGTERESEASFAVTDASGRFVFEGLSPGRYVLWASHDGYVASHLLDHSHRGTPLSLAPGQHIKDLVFRLTPTCR